MTFSCGILSNVFSFVFKDSHTDSENISLLRLFDSDEQKTCSSKDVSLLGI